MSFFFFFLSFFSPSSSSSSFSSSSSSSFSSTSSLSFSSSSSSSSPESLPFTLLVAESTAALISSDGLAPSPLSSPSEPVADSTAFLISLLGLIFSFCGAKAGSPPSTGASSTAAAAASSACGASAGSPSSWAICRPMMAGVNRLPAKLSRAGAGEGAAMPKPTARAVADTKVLAMVRRGILFSCCWRCATIAALKDIRIGRAMRMRTYKFFTYGWVVGLLLVCFAPPVTATTATAKPLVDAAWSVSRIGAENIRFLDIRGGGAADFEAGHIPGAVYSDYFNAGWRVTGQDGTPGMLPPVADLERLLGQLGISNTKHVVIVARGLSAVEMASAARVFWTFKVLGHDAVSILDGGMTAYRALAGAPLEGGAVNHEKAMFTASYRPALVASKADVISAQQAGGALLDLRPESQFTGARGPRFMREKGTIAGARNLPLTGLTNDGVFKTPAVLAELFSEAHVTAGEPLTCFCNTGHMAALGWFVAYALLGNDAARLYDGSMAEWSQDPGREIVKGVVAD
ncbi:MAG: sulfurtransferase [Rhodospirillaceae bacterium]|nr:sulfurtransferase [Rhodospirillaceae bacterium]